VKIIEPKISVSNVRPDFVEISNQSNDEINLYNWTLSVGDSNFVFPKDTIISSGKIVDFANSVTKLLIKDGSAIRLLDPSGKMISSFVISGIEEAIEAQKKELLAEIVSVLQRKYLATETRSSEQLVQKTNNSNLSENSDAESGMSAEQAEVAAMQNGGSSTQVANVYEVAKPKGLLERSWNFIKGIFSRD
jgi:hypothetical protein